MTDTAPLILHASDIHLGAHMPECVDAFVAHVAAMKPALTVLSGDITDGGREEEYRLAEALLKRLTGPVMVVPGNHDAPVTDLVARFRNPYGRFRRLRGAVLEVRAGTASVASLRTAEAVQWRLDWSKGAVSKQRLRSALALLPPGRDRDRRWRVLVGHHPLRDPPGTLVPGRVRGGERAYALASAHGVDLILAGHTHESFIGVPDSEAIPGSDAPLLGIAPTLSSPRLRGERQGFHAYRLLPDWLEAEVWRWGEDDFALEKVVTVARPTGGGVTAKAA